MDSSVKRKIRVCVFDSGIGGINVLYECMRKLPQVDFFYFADNFNVPYGNLSSDELIEKADGHFKKIAEVKPAVAVIACNTVTATCAEFLRKKYPFPIIGIQPAVKPAATVCGEKLVLATKASATSQSLNELIRRYGNGECKVEGCEHLAEYIEKNVFNLKEREVFELLPPAKPSAVVLGCTHYAYVADAIAKFYGCEVFDGKEGVARRLCQLLGNFDHFAKINGKVTFCGGDELKNATVLNMLVAKNGR